MRGKVFGLYGYERFYAMDRGASARLAHVLTVRGDVAKFVKELPQAVLRTFNLHPKMRTVLLPGASPQKAMVCPPLVDACELDAVLSIRECEGGFDWAAFVQAECEKPVDREKDFPYAFCVLVETDLARLVLFSDHYMSDVTSGSIVLESLLRLVEDFGSGRSHEAHSADELPFHNSLYESMHYVNPLLGVINEAVSKFVLQPLANFENSGFTPVLQINAESQRDYDRQPPTPRNPSFALFATGTPANMQRTLQICQEQEVSLQGAFVAAASLAVGMVKYGGCLTACESELRFKMELEADMRAPTGHQGVVGMYSTLGNLVFTSSQGVGPRSTPFWVLARQADEEWAATLDGHEMKLQSVFVNETLNAERGPSSLHVAHSIVSDMALSCLDASTWSQRTCALHVDGSTSSVTIDSLHVYKSLPSLAAASTLFVTATSAFNFSLMHKLESAVADDFFHWFVQCVEHLGEIGENEPLAQVATRLKEMQAPVVYADALSASGEE